MENIRKTCVYCGRVFAPYPSAGQRQLQCGADACRSQKLKEERARGTYKAKLRSAAERAEREARLAALQIVCRFCQSKIEKPKHSLIKYCGKKCRENYYRVRDLEAKIKKIESGYYIQRDIKRIRQKIEAIKMSRHSDIFDNAARPENLTHRRI